MNHPKSAYQPWFNLEFHNLISYSKKGDASALKAEMLFPHFPIVLNIFPKKHTKNIYK